MPRLIRITAVQTVPVSVGADLTAFAREVTRLAGHSDVIVYPELHLFGSDDAADAERSDRLADAAVSLCGTLVDQLGGIARAAGVWLIPGTICERGPEGQLFNTALVFSPEGELARYYRKIFPWRPSEPFHPGDRFAVVDLGELGRIGLSIGHDAWFPEVTRHLAWLGAEIVVNLTRSIATDREQDIVVARANAIVNQTFMVTVNRAGPPGTGRSAIVGPEGEMLTQSMGSAEESLTRTVDCDRISYLREISTAGGNTIWSQFDATDDPLDLPLYAGRIKPYRWMPRGVPPAPSYAG